MLILNFLLKKIKKKINSFHFIFNFSDVCSVCLDQLGEHPSSLECRHRFHRECIERSLLHSPLCPMCRAHAKVAL